jgi:hypothetical protein
MGLGFGKRVQGEGENEKKERKSRREREKRRQGSQHDSESLLCEVFDAHEVGLGTGAMNEWI